MEAFSAYAAHLSTTSKFFLLDQAKFYEYIALEGERIGQIQRNISELKNELAAKTAALSEKQQKLFNLKDISKWANPDLLRMVAEDQKELLKDAKNMSLILPAEQQELWRLKQLICTLIISLQ